MKGRAQMDLGLLYKIKKKRACAVQHLKLRPANRILRAPAPAESGNAYELLSGSTVEHRGIH